MVTAKVYLGKYFFRFDHLDTRFHAVKEMLGDIYFETIREKLMFAAVFGQAPWRLPNPCKRVQKTPWLPPKALFSWSAIRSEPVVSSCSEL